MPLCVLATGGTIASLADPESGAVRPAVGAEDLIRSVPGLDAFGPLTVEEVAAVNGWNVTPATMLAVAQRARTVLGGDEYDGVIVTHGTDTVEETAFLCDVLVDSEKPVVFAAAMRSGDEVAADGPRNLLAAARVATDPAARGCGAVLVMNDEVHAGCRVRKLDSYRVSAFGSPGSGPLGLLKPDGLRMSPRAARVTLAMPAALDRPVPIVKTHTGMDEALIEAVAAASGAAGLVLEGTGLGNVPGSAMPGIAAVIAKGLPVVVATAVTSGGTAPHYGGPGGGVTLREMGALAAGGLPAAKARLLLMTLLSTEPSAQAAAARFSAIVEVLQ
jgi:L-asparaginase